MSNKSKSEQMAEKKEELEKRLQDVTGKLGSKPKKGVYFFLSNFDICTYILIKWEYESNISILFEIEWNLNLKNKYCTKIKNLLITYKQNDVTSVRCQNIIVLSSQTILLF